jgi:hypothetical protein
MLKKTVFAALTMMLVTFGGLNTSMAGHAFGSGCGGKGDCVDKLEPPSQAESDGMQYMREEEKLARDIYLIMADKWGLIVFTNIARSEQKHMDAVKNLLYKYDVEDPVKDESPANEGSDFTNDELGILFEYFKEKGLMSVMAALQVGGEIEEIDIQDIQTEIDQADQDRIISTYENLMCGSTNHLRAFVKQIEIRGETYEPLNLTEDELAAIVELPTARNCGHLKTR